MNSSWLCVDANLVIRLVTDPADNSIRSLWWQWDSDRRRLAAPTLLYYEVANAFHQYQTLGLMSAASARLAFKAPLTPRIELQGGAHLHWRALELANRFSLRAAYDAHYLTVAEQLKGEFWTSDGRLARAVESSLPWVHMVA